MVTLSFNIVFHPIYLPKSGDYLLALCFIQYTCLKVVTLSFNIVFQPIYLPISGDFILDKDEHDVGTFIQVQRFVNVQQHLPGIEKKSSEQLFI